MTDTVYGTAWVCQECGVTCLHARSVHTPDYCAHLKSEVDAQVAYESWVAAYGGTFLGDAYIAGWRARNAEIERLREPLRQIALSELQDRHSIAAREALANGKANYV